MQFVAAAGAGVVAVAWIWGSLSGRLASMIAAIISPNWISGAGYNGQSSGLTGTQSLAAGKGAVFNPKTGSVTAP